MLSIYAWGIGGRLLNAEMVPHLACVDCCRVLRGINSVLRMVWPFQYKVLPRVNLASYLLPVSAGFSSEGSRLIYEVTVSDPCYSNQSRAYVRMAVVTYDVVLI